MLYKTWLREWLQTFIKIKVKPRTFFRYGEIINTHLIPNLGDYEMDLLTTVKLQEFIVFLLRNGNQKTGGALAVNSVNGIINVLKSSLETAYELSLIKENTANKIQRPRLKENVASCFSRTEQKRIEGYIINAKKAKMFGILLCLYTGLRIGELLALEWSDLDFTQGVIKVSKTCYYCKSEKGKYMRQTTEPKTLSSVRIIPIPRQMVSYLKEIKKESNSVYVISNASKSISVRSYQRSFCLMLRKLGIEHKNFHALRHTFATRAIECGVDVKTLSEILGHKTVAITLNRYAHSLMDHKKAMMNKIGNLLNVVN